MRLCFSAVPGSVFHGKCMRSSQHSQWKRSDIRCLGHALQLVAKAVRYQFFCHASR